MTGRRTIDQITSDELDQLYGRVEFYEAAVARMRDRAEVTSVRLDRIRDAARLHRQTLISTAELYAATEAGTDPDPFSYEERERTGRNAGLTIPAQQPATGPAGLHARYVAAILTIRDHHLETVTRTLATVLDRLKPLRDETGTPIGYVVHPVDPDEYQRWRDALNPKEQ